MDRREIAKQEQLGAQRFQLKDLLKTRMLGAELDASKGVGPGFDFLRLALAILIFYGHTSLLTVVATPPTFASDLSAATNAGDLVSMTISALKTRGYVLFVPMFFALSGFLVAGSALRLQHVGQFLGFRVLRILPALLVEVTLSALILGAIFTTLPLRDYFTDPQFFRYFGNIVGHITFHLPGVFTSNPKTDYVNGALWTLPPEFFCYLILSALMILGILGRRQIVLVLFVACAIVIVPASLFYGIGITGTFYSTSAIVSYFVAGVLTFLYREKVPLNFGAAIICGLVALAAVPYPRMAFVLVPFLTYLTVWVGLQSWLALPFMKGRDYSYGIYLYNFPICQAIIATIPGISRGQLIVSGLITSLAFAAFSWHFIEKPFLRFKSLLVSDRFKIGRWTRTARTNAAETDKA
ncbi:acyltransferase 3 [Rhodoplanes sp. Z2-YC6860]|nr:acyltransferase 3 [Rhodoplanes sp. Z2-YC6860]